MVREGLEERFGLWLQNQDMTAGRQQIQTSLQGFLSTIRADHRRNAVADNPFYYVRHGIFLNHSQKWDEARRDFTEAIRKDPRFCENGYYHLAFTLIQQKDLDGARANFKKCVKMIEQYQENVINMMGVYEQSTPWIPPQSVGAGAKGEVAANAEEDGTEFSRQQANMLLLCVPPAPASSANL